MAKKQEEFEKPSKLSDINARQEDLYNANKDGYILLAQSLGKKDNTSDAKSTISKTVDNLSKLSKQDQYYVLYQAVRDAYSDEIKKATLNQQSNFSWLKDAPGGSSGSGDKDDIKLNEQASSTTDITTFVTDSLNTVIKSGKTLHAVGPNYSSNFSDVGSGDIQLKLTSKGYINVACTIDTSVLTKEAAMHVENGYIIDIEAGATVGDINDVYWPTSEYKSLTKGDGSTYKVIPNRGGYLGLSVIGLSQVGAMGYSNYLLDSKTNKYNPNLGSIQDAILSLRLLTVEDDKVVSYQIESSSNPIHDKSKWSSIEKDVTLIQDDSLFSDVITSFGSYGVITHAFIKLTDAYYLANTRFCIIPANFQFMFDQISNDKSVHMVQFWVNPYGNDNTTDTVKQLIVADVFRKIESTEYSNSLNPYKPKSTDELLIAAVVSELLQILQLGTSIPLWFALEDLARSEIYIQPCVEALNFKPGYTVTTTSNGIAFDMNKYNVVSTIQAYISWLNDYQSKNGKEYCVTSPFAVRFAKQSNGILSPAGTFDVCWVEQPMVTMWPFQSDAKTIAETLLNDQRKWFQSNYGGKLHFGLWFNSKDSGNLDNYIVTDTWKTHYKKFNSSKIFKNGFTTLAGFDS